MKKCIMILIILGLTSTAVFSLDMKVGGGANFDYNNSNGGTSSYGGHVFVDFKYLELSANYSLSSVGNIDMHNLTFNALGKYPIELGPLTVFPMAGANYNMVVYASQGGNKISNASDYNQFGLLFGAGADFNLSGALFMRASALWNVRLENKMISGVSQGPQIKVSVGTTF